MTTTQKLVEALEEALPLVHSCTGRHDFERAEKCKKSITEALALARQRVEGEVLEEALKAMVALAPDPNEPVEVFERIGEWFRRETGLLRPGKDWPMMAGTPPKDLNFQFEKWIQTKQSLALKQARAALIAAARGEEIK